MSLGLLLAVGLSVAPADWARAVSGMEKVRPEHVPSGQRAATLVLSRGECGLAQVAVTPPLKHVTARAQPLVVAGGTQTLAPRLFREAFVPVTTPSNARGATGLWPDPLVPDVDAFLGEHRNAFPADSTPREPLVVAVEVCVPEHAAPGSYLGAVDLRASGVPDARVPVTVEVLRGALPATSSLPNSFGLSLYSVARGHHVSPQSSEARELLKRYMMSALEHRISLHGLSMDPPPVHDDPASPDFRSYDAEVGPFLDGTVLPSGARFTSTDLRLPRSLSDEAATSYARAFRRHLEQRGWKGQLFFYAKDEPKPTEIPLVVAQAAPIEKAGVATLVTSPFDARLVGSAGVLCPNLNCFFPRSGPATCPRVETVDGLRRLLPAAHVWWYQSCSSHGCNGLTGEATVDRAYTGWASYMIDHALALNRAMGALAFLAGVDGELYFDTVSAFNAGDPWTGVYGFGGNGDGTLFYPGTPAHIGGSHDIPVMSLRLEAIRQGLQDYEYLTALARHGDAAFARQAALKVARSGYDIDESAADWDAFHEALARRLDERLRLAHAP